MSRKFLTGILLFILNIVAGCQTNNPIVCSRLTGNYWQIWAMMPDGSNLKQVTKSLSDKRYPIWNTNGWELLCSDNDNQALIIDTDNGAEHRILESFGKVGRIVPSPDGKKLLFVRFKSELMDSSDLWVTSVDGNEQRILTREVGLQYDPEWSPDGKNIICVSGHGYQTHELYIMDSDGRNRKRLTNNKALELLPSFSPDGKKIAYVSDMTGDFEIWTMNVDGADTKQLTNSAGIDTRPRWSPDGKRILFVSSRTGSLQLWIMDGDGASPVQITKGAPCNDPDWRKLSK